MAASTRALRRRERRAPPGSCRGFTLIELMISVSVASVILVASYLCLSAGVASQKLIEPRVEVLQTARTALAMMSADLRSACSLSKDFDFVGMNRVVEGKRVDNVDFATHFYTPSRAREGDYCQVSYYIDRSRKSAGLSLWRRRNPVIAPDPQAGGSKEEIARGVRALKLEYYDGTDWYDSWGNSDPKQRQKNTSVDPPNLSGFPEAVRITLWLDPNPRVVQPRPGSGGSLADEAAPDENPPPPMVFQTVVRLELADAALPGASGSSTSTNASATTDNSQQPQGGPGGMN